MPRPLASLARVDLNLLTIFRALDETRHVTRAARLLGLSQPALSHALARLRDAFDDPMFVRTPQGMALTPLAELLAGPIRIALGQIEQDVLERGPFHPRELSREFKLRTTDYLEALVAPAILSALESEAPRARFASLPVGTALPKDELQSGTVDLDNRRVLWRTSGRLSPTTAVRRQIRVRGSQGTSFRTEAEVSLDGFSEARHVLVAPGGELTGAVDRALSTQKRERRVVAGTSGFMAATWIVSQSQCVLTAPARLLDKLAEPLQLHIFEPPIELPPVREVQVWHARSDSDRAHSWFRGIVKQSTANL